MDLGTLGSIFGGLSQGLAQGAEAGISLSQKQQQIDLQKEQQKISFLGAVNTLSNLPQSARRTFGPAIIKGMEKAFGTEFPEEYKAIFLKGEDDQNKSMWSIVAKAYQQSDFSPEEFAKATAGMPLDKRLQYFKMAMEGIKSSQMLETRRDLARSGIRYIYDDQGRRIGAVYDRAQPGASANPSTPTTPGAATPASKTPATPTTPLGPLPDKTDDQKAAEVTGLLDTADRGPQIQPEGVPRSALAPKPTTIPLEMDKAETAQAPLPTPAKPTPPPISSAIPWVNKADWSKTGEEFARQLPSAIAVNARGLANYTIDPSKLSAGTRAELIAAAKQINPDYDQMKAPARSAFMNSLARGGPQATMLDSSRMVVTHLQLASELSDAMKTGNVQAINSVVSKIRAQTGNTAVTNAELGARVLGTEMARFLRGAGALSVEEERLWTAEFNAGKLTPDQILGKISTAWKAMGGRMAAFKERADAAWQGDFPMFTPGSDSEASAKYLTQRFGPAAKFMQRYVPQGTETPEKSAATPAAPATGGPPPSAVDYLRKNPQFAPQFDEKYGAGSAKRYLGQ